MGVIKHNFISWVFSLNLPNLLGGRSWSFIFALVRTGAPPSIYDIELVAPGSRHRQTWEGAGFT